MKRQLRSYHEDETHFLDDELLANPDEIIDNTGQPPDSSAD